MRAHIVVNLVLVVCAASAAWAQQAHCTVALNVVNALDPYITSALAAAGNSVAPSLWTPVRDLPAEAFIARSKRHLIRIASVETDRGARRIVFAGWRRAGLCGWGLGATQTSLSMLRRDESLR